MASSPYFSVIIPTYNRAKYIVTAVESVLAQTFKEFELIIVDDGSSDDTAARLAPFLASDPRIQYIMQENRGRSVARNVGIDTAQGEYICFLDSDDYWLQQHLHNIFESLQTLQKPTFIFTGLSYHFPSETTEKRFPPIEDNKPIDYVIGNQVSTITVAIPREILTRQKFNPSLVINEDLELWARIVAELPLLYIDEVTAVAVQHETNTRHVETDPVSYYESAMALVFENNSLRPFYSKAFKKRRLQGILELRIREDEQNGKKWSLIKNILKFLALYPTALRNRAKVVMLIYALPGGGMLRRLIQN